MWGSLSKRYDLFIQSINQNKKLKEIICSFESCLSHHASLVRRLGRWSVPAGFSEEELRRLNFLGCSYL